MKITTLTVDTRWAIRRDLDEIMDIERRSFTPPWSEAEMKQMMGSRETVAKVAYYRETLRVVGFIVYSFDAHDPRGDIFVHNIAVHPEERRLGIGSRLLRDLIARQLDDSRRLVALALDTNLGGHLFFARHGFRATKVEKCKDHRGRFCEAYEFVRPATEGTYELA